MAESVGIDDTYNGQSLSLIDINNDGNQSMIIGNFNGPLVVYTPETLNKNFWIGINLIGVKSNSKGIGSRITILNNGLSLSKEVFPGNGVHSQSDIRQIFGLGSHIRSDCRIMINWPSGINQELNCDKVNQYITVVEKEN